MCLHCRGISWHSFDYLSSGRSDFFVSFSELYASNKSIIEVAESLRLSEFVRLMKTSGLSSELNSTARYTIFIPSDQAFSALPPDTLKELEGDKELLRDTLLLHIASGKIVTEAMKDNSKIATLDGSGELRINIVDDGEVSLGKTFSPWCINKDLSSGVFVPGQPKRGIGRVAGTA